MVAVTNRVRPHFIPDEPTAEERQRFVTDAVTRAMSAVVGLLDHADPKVVLKAAGMLLDLEKTRIRHGRAVLEPTPAPPVVEPQPVVEAEAEVEPEEKPFPTPETHPELFYMRDEPWMHDGQPVGQHWRGPCFKPQIPAEEEWDKLPRGKPIPDFARDRDDV